jgi:hypothetical protein
MQAIFVAATLGYERLTASLSASEYNGEGQCSVKQIVDALTQGVGAASDCLQPDLRRDL